MNIDLDYIESELKQTTVGYKNTKWTIPPVGTHWANALARLATLYIVAPAPVPPPLVTPTPTATTTPTTTAVKTFAGGSLSAFLAGLKPGDYAVMTADGSLSQSISNGGTATSRIHLDMNGHIVDGRLDMRGGAVFWVWGNGGFRDLAPLAAGHQQSWCIGGSDNIFHDFESINGHTKIGWEFINDSTYGVSHRNELRNYRIHQIGRETSPLTNNDHGVYDVGYSQHYIDGLHYDCSDRALQLRGAKSAHAEYITWTDCGEGEIFGDIGAVGTITENFIATNNRQVSRELIEEYDPNNNDSNNIVRNGFVFETDGRTGIGSFHSVAISNVKDVDPQLDADYMPIAGSPAVGYGCRVKPPIFF